MADFMGADRNGSAAGAVSPCGPGLVPFELAGQGADGVEVAFQVGEFVGAGVFAFDDSFWAGFAGGADGEDRSLDGGSSFEAVAPADFEEADVALAVIEIPFEGGGHGDEAVRTEDVGFFGERVREARWRDAFSAEKRVAFFGYVRDGEDFAVAEPHEAFADTQRWFVFCKPLRALPRGRQARGKFVEAVDASDFFDEIDFAFDFGAPTRLGAFPGGEQRAFRAAIFADAHWSEAERAQDGFDFLVGNIRAHDTEKFGARQLNFFRLAFARINIDDTRE